MGYFNALRASRPVLYINLEYYCPIYWRLADVNEEHRKSMNLGDYIYFLGRLKIQHSWVAFYRNLKQCDIKTLLKSHFICKVSNKVTPTPQIARIAHTFQNLPWIMQGLQECIVAKHSTTLYAEILQCRIIPNLFAFIRLERPRKIIIL